MLDVGARQDAVRRRALPAIAVPSTAQAEQRPADPPDPTGFRDGRNAYEVPTCQKLPCIYRRPPDGRVRPIGGVVEMGLVDLQERCEYVPFRHRVIGAEEHDTQAPQLQHHLMRRPPFVYRTGRCVVQGVGEEDRSRTIEDAKSRRERPGTLAASHEDIAIRAAGTDNAVGAETGADPVELTAEGEIGGGAESARHNTDFLD